MREDNASLEVSPEFWLERRCFAEFESLDKKDEGHLSRPKIS